MVLPPEAEGIGPRPYRHNANRPSTRWRQWVFQVPVPIWTSAHEPAALVIVNIGQSCAALLAIEETYLLPNHLRVLHVLNFLPREELPIKLTDRPSE